ncbi:MAG: hypothetical protein ACR2K1_00025 [Saprospiraceae bacterium]
MNSLFSIAVRALFTFVAFLALQYIIPYYFLAIGGLLAGIFIWKTGDDKALAFGLMIGSAVFGVFAYYYGTV